MTLLNAKKESTGNSTGRSADYAVSTQQTQDTMLYDLESVSQSQRIFDTTINFRN